MLDDARGFLLAQDLEEPIDGVVLDAEECAALLAGMEPMFQVSREREALQTGSSSALARVIERTREDPRVTGEAWTYARGAGVMVAMPLVSTRTRAPGDPERAARA